MGEPPPDAELDRIRQERDLYLRLLQLGDQDELDPFLKEALALVVEVTGASRGYLELRDASREEGEAWWIAHDCSSAELEGIRSAISRGIVAEALATGRTIVTPAAFLDPRFEARQSVRAGHIEAVLCAPLGDDASRGVVYLQGREGRGPFSDEDRERVEMLARRLAPLAERVLARRRARVEEDPTQPLRARLRLDGFVGRSRALAAVLREAALVAPLDVTVLLTGESGTGKSQLARVIHDNGPRAGGPFVELSCAAIPETLVENELFGHRAGAHSAAQRAAPGKVEAAEGGTLFLDEVGELPLASQAKLLQLLQTRDYYPLGATKPLRADVRVIAATNLDLAQAVKERRFREDLLYRLQVLCIRLPSLAERREDVPELAGFFCERTCEHHRLRRVRLSPGALLAAREAAWPGNVRQLAHAIEAATIRAAGEAASHVERTHVFPESEAPGPSDPPRTFQDATRCFQRELLQRSLEETDWNVTEVARRLDLARSHVYNLIHSFGLERGKPS